MNFSNARFFVYGIALTIACFLAAPAPHYEIPQDCTSGRYVVDIKIHENAWALNMNWIELGGWYPVHGFTMFFDDAPPVMHIERLRFPEYDPQSMDTWGHELSHVVCGDWHPNLPDTPP